MDGTYGFECVRSAYRDDLYFGTKVLFLCHEKGI